MSKIGYVAVITEVERGWGQRSDGFLVGRKREDIQAFIEKSRAFNRDSEEYSVAGETFMCELTEKADEELIKECLKENPLDKSKKDSVIWINKQGDMNKYVLNS